MNEPLTESHLVSIFEGALRENSTTVLPNFSRVIAEFEAKQGRPDLVALPNVAGIPKRVRERLAIGLASPSSSLVLSMLRPAAARTESYIVQRTALSPAVIANALDSLLQAGLIVNSGSGYVLGRSVPADLVEVWAFEVKVENWKRALFQALQYRAFATRAVVVLPERCIHRIEPYKKQFQSFAVGILSLEPSTGELRMVVSPRQRKPSSLFHYYYAIGKLFP